MSAVKIGERYWIVTAVARCMFCTVTKKAKSASVPKVPRAMSSAWLFPFQSSRRRAISTPQMIPETRQRKKTISIAGMRSSCFTKTFIVAKASVARSMLATPGPSRREPVRRNGLGRSMHRGCSTRRGFGQEGSRRASPEIARLTWNRSFADAFPSSFLPRRSSSLPTSRRLRSIALPGRALPPARRCWRGMGWSAPVCRWRPRSGSKS